MRCTHSGRALAAPALTFILLLGACADAPTSPPSPRAPAAPRPQAGLSSYTNGSELTVWDEDGTAYTLRPSLSEIHSSDGTVFELTPSELADAMTAFVAAHEGDQTSNALAAATEPRNGECAVVPTACLEYPYDAGGPVPTPVPLDGLSPLPPPGVGGFVARRAESGDSLPSADFDADRLQYLGSCVDIANAIYDATLQHRESRGAVLNVLKSAVSLTVATNGFSLRVKLANFQSLGFRLENAAHYQLTRTTQLNILAGLYGAYGCWYGGWGSGSVGSSYLVPPPPVYRSCRREMWFISVDGGSTWTQREVQVCEYYMD